MDMTDSQFECGEAGVKQGASRESDK